MSLWDLEERTWWVFKLPEATSYVPANSEAEARAKMRKNSYEKAPVHTWPLIGTRFTSRQVLTASLLRHR